MSRNKQFTTKKKMSLSLYRDFKQYAAKRISQRISIYIATLFLRIVKYTDRNYFALRIKEQKIKDKNLSL